MSIEIKTTELVMRIVVVTPVGRLDSSQAPAVRAACDRYFDQGCVQFVFDLSGLTMMDSAGLAVLVGTLKRARENGGDVRLIWPTSEDASRVLKLTKFDRVFTSIKPAEIVPKSF